MGHRGVALFQLDASRGPGSSLHQPVFGHISPGHRPAQYGHAKDTE